MRRAWKKAAACTPGPERRAQYLALPPSSAAPGRALEGQAGKSPGGVSTCVRAPAPSLHGSHRHEARKRGFIRAGTARQYLWERRLGVRRLDAALPGTRGLQAQPERKGQAAGFQCVCDMRHLAPLSLAKSSHRASSSCQGTGQCYSQSAALLPHLPSRLPLL